MHVYSYASECVWVCMCMRVHTGVYVHACAYSMGVLTSVCLSRARALSLSLSPSLPPSRAVSIPPSLPPSLHSSVSPSLPPSHPPKRTPPHTHTASTLDGGGHSSTADSIVFGALPTQTKPQIQPRNTLGGHSSTADSLAFGALPVFALY